MSLIVTLKVFSGHPNPTWILPEAAADEYNDRLRRIANTARISNLKPAAALGGLGYRGFQVQRIGERSSTFVHAGIVDTGRPSAASFLTENRELEAWLLTTGEKHLSEGVHEHVVTSLKAGLATYGGVILTQPFNPCPISHAADAPAYDQKPWWSGPETEESNNCYNYANNRITNTIAQPGRASNHLFTQTNNCTDPGSVFAAAISDGLVPAPNFTTQLAAGQGWYVALVLWPGHDFHWYRQDNNGCWSQKPDGDYVNSVDNSRNRIADPKTADRGPYTIFCSYMITRCGVKIS